MAFPRNLMLDDDGLSKKYDSPRTRPADRATVHMPWQSFRRRRLFLGILVLLLLYVFVKNIPNDVPPVSHRYSPVLGSLASGHSRLQLDNHQSSIGKHEGAKQPHTGQLRLPYLAESLREFVRHPQRDNVVFAALHLHSISKLLPMACQMRQQNHNSVHFVLFGGYSASLEDILKANGISKTDCPVIWHDARPDDAEQSPSKRIQASIKAGFSFVNQALAPQVLLMEELTHFDASLTAVMKEVATKLRVPVITVPDRAYRNLAWITSLESESLRRFNEVRIDVLIQPYSQSAGSVIKLLRSLSNAQYEGLNVPRLTVELPSKADPYLLKYLAKFRWPPRSLAAESKLTVRRRLEFEHIGPSDAALRTVESFYPADSSSSHLLVLNPDIELSPIYMHYLMYTVLSYKYARTSKPESTNLFGISLELPQAKLDGSQPFFDTKLTKDDPFVLSQVPNGNAALYFGDHWAQFHQFLSRRLSLDPQLKSKTKDEIVVSRENPQWIVHAQEMMRALGLYMLYPAHVESEKDQIAKLHRELHHDPEEFAVPEDETPAIPEIDMSQLTSNKVFTGGVDSAKQPPEPFLADTTFSVPGIMSDNSQGKGQQTIPPLSELTMLSASGERLTWERYLSYKAEYADQFARLVGGCAERETSSRFRSETVESLFCKAKS